MGYRIEYHTVQKKQRTFISFIRLPVLTILCFLAFLFLVDVMWPEGAALIQKSGLFSRSTVAVSALNDLADKLYCGEPLVTAFADFCGKLKP